MFSQSVDTPQTSLFGLLHILLSEENLHRDSALSATSRWLYWNPTLMAPNDGPPNTRSLQLCTSCTTILSYSRKIVYTYFGQLSYLDCTMKIKNPLNIFIFLNQCLPDIITIYPCIWAGKTAVRQVCLDHTALLGCSSAYSNINDMHRKSMQINTFLSVPCIVLIKLYKPLTWLLHKVPWCGVVWDHHRTFRISIIILTSFVSLSTKLKKRKSRYDDKIQ